MAITINCPNCRSVVRSPEELIGKKVQCPKCSTVFRVEDPNSPFAEVVDEVEVVEDEPPRPKRRARPDDEEEFEDDRPRRRGRRARAASAAKGPGIALLVAGILGLLYSLWNSVVLLTSNQPPAILNNPQFAGNPDAVRVGMMIGAVMTFVWAIVVTIGGAKMMRLESWGFAIFAAIFALLPCNVGCLLGLPFGIWALVVLNNPDVKESFAS